MKPLLFLLAWGLLAPCAAHAIMLGGTEVPRDKFILFLFFGHSNMDGVALRQDNTVHPRCWAYVKGEWIPARDKDLPFQGTRRIRSSCVYHFIKRMAADYPEYHFGALKITGQAWHLNSGGFQIRRGGIGYRQLVDAYGEIKHHGTLGGLVTMIGMCDAGRGTPESKRAFKGDLLAWLGHIRADLGAPDLPIVLGRLEMVDDEEIEVTVLASFVSSHRPDDVDARMGPPISFRC